MHERIYALYNTMETAVSAVNEVIAQGISPDHVSVITHDPNEKYARYLDINEHDDVEADEGASFGTLVGALTGLSVALIPGFGPVFATGPLAVALMTAIGAGSGAIVGGISAALIDFGADEAEVEYYESVLRNGGALAIVDTYSEAEEDLVQRLLESYQPLEMED